MDHSQRPIPVPDPDSAPYWTAAREGRLAGQVCAACGQVSFPPRPICPACRSDRMEWRNLDGRGTVQSFAIVRMNFVRGYEAPFIAAWVVLDAHPEVRMNVNIVDCGIESVRIGMPVEVCFEERRDGIRVPQFRPAGGAA